MSTTDLTRSVTLNRDGIQGVWVYERDCVSERMRCRREREGGGWVTCSHKDGTQQHQHRTAAKNKHRLKARVRQKEQETLLSPHCGYTDACTTPPLYTTSSVNFSKHQCDASWVKGFYTTRSTTYTSAAYENKWLRQACHLHPCTTLTYHEIQLILLVANKLKGHQRIENRILVPAYLTCL